MLRQEIREKILKNSLSLEKFGLNDLAWSKENAKDLIQSIKTDHIGVLGGDVYILKPLTLESAYDNWYCERKNTESEEEYYARSKVESLKYIENYFSDPSENIIFSITFTEHVD